MMNSPMTEPMTERYSLSRRVLHWLSAAVILWATASGFTSALATLPPVVEQTIGAFNVALTLLFIPVFGLRLWLAVSGHKPSTPGLSRRQQRTAAAGHWLIYSAVLLVLFSGFSMMERPMTVFGLFELAPWLPPSAATRFSRICIITAARCWHCWWPGILLPCCCTSSVVSV